MVVRRRSAGASTDLDQGLTLIEVVVALALMTIVLLSGGGFMIHTMATSSTMNGRQGAVAVANQVLEQIRAVNPTFDSTGASPLVYGRGQSTVVAQWTAAAAAGLDISGTYIGNGVTGFDADTYQTSAIPTVPFQQTVMLGNQAYTVNALIGTCVRALTSGACTKTAVGDELFRVVVRVTWSAGAQHTCSGTPCAFVLSTLIDPTQDPIFNANRKPVANPDSATTAYATPVDIGVTVNDSGDFALAGSVTLLTNPVNGTTSQSNNIVTFTPAAGFSGTNTFTYTVTDTSGRVSNATTVTINVTPLAVNDVEPAVNVKSGAVVTDVLANDHGTGLSLVSAAAPTGTAVISGTKISYTPSATASGLVTVTYTAQDSAGQQYTGTLSVTVRPIAATTVTTATCWPGWSTTGSVHKLSTTLPAAAFVGTGPFTIPTVMLTPTIPAGAVVTASGMTLTYTLPAGAPVPQSISYTVADAGGVVSTSIPMTLKGTCP